MKYPPSITGLKLQRSDDSSTFLTSCFISWKRTFPLSFQSSIEKYLVRVWANDVRVREEYVDNTYYEYSDETCINDLNAPLEKIYLEVYGVDSEGNLSTQAKNLSARRKYSYPFMGRLWSYLDASDNYAITLDGSHLYLSGSYIHTDGSSYAIIAKTNKNNLELLGARLFKNMTINGLCTDASSLYATGNYNSSVLLLETNKTNLQLLKSYYWDSSNNVNSVGYDINIDSSNLYITGEVHTGSYFAFVQCLHTDSSHTVFARGRRFYYGSGVSPSLARFNTLTLDGSYLYLTGAMDSNSIYYGIVARLNKLNFATNIHKAYANTKCVKFNQNYICGDYYNDTSSYWQGWLGDTSSSLALLHSYRFAGNKKSNIRGIEVDTSSSYFAYGRTYEGKFTSAGLFTDQETSKVVIVRDKGDIKQAIYDNDYLYFISSCNFGSLKRTMLGRISDQMEDITCSCDTSISLSESTPCSSLDYTMTRHSFTPVHLGCINPQGIGAKIFIADDPSIEVSSLGSMTIW